jgi:hypothetical protein
VPKLDGTCRKVDDFFAEQAYIAAQNVEQPPGLRVTPSWDLDQT